MRYPSKSSVERWLKNVAARTPAAQALGSSTKSYFHRCFRNKRYFDINYFEYWDYTYHTEAHGRNKANGSQEFSFALARIPLPPHDDTCIGDAPLNGRRANIAALRETGRRSYGTRLYVFWDDATWRASPPRALTTTSSRAMPRAPHARVQNDVRGDQGRLISWMRYAQYFKRRHRHQLTA